MDAQEHRGRFDRAVAYFNAGRFYEAHEDWEEIWHESEGAHRLWIQGLIQYAAALVHYARGYYPRGFAKLMREATEKVEGYDGDTEFMDWPAFQSAVAPWIEHGLKVESGADLVKDAPPQVPVVVYVDGYRPAPLPLDEEE